MSTAGSSRTGRFLLRSLLGLALTAAVASPAALANRADFDLSFGTDGVVRLAVQEQSQLIDLAVQPDGRIVGVGFAEQGGVRQWAVVRFNSDGSLDSGFGNNGVTLLAPPPSRTIGLDVPRNVVVNSTGHILVCGESTLMRLTPQGLLDISYGTGGSYVPPLASNQSYPMLLDLVPSGDGGFYLSGGLYMVWVPLPSYATRNAAVIKLTDAGLIDTTFAANGVAYVQPVYPPRFYAEASSVLPSGGAIYLGGAEQNRQGRDTTGTVYKMGSDGTHDVQFSTSGGNGSLRLFSGDWNNASYVAALARQSSGALLVAGVVGGFLGSELAIKRIFPDGTVDASFTDLRIAGVGGAYTTRPSPQLLIDTDDYIVASGFGSDMASLMGLLPNGAVDPSFGNNGLAAMPFGGSRVRQLVRQPDGKYLAIGGSEYGSAYGSTAGAGGAMYIARLRGSALIPPELVTTPDSGGSFTLANGSPGQSQLLGTIGFGNRGGDPLVITNCTASAGFSVGGNFPLTIATGTSQSVPVSCSMPGAPLTTQAGTLTCSGINDTDETSVSYSLSCTSGAGAVATSVPAASRGVLALMAAALALLGLGAFRRRSSI